MGRALILIESLSAAVLLVALAAAWTARRPRGLGRWAVPMLVALAVAAPAGLTVYGMSLLNRIGTVSTNSYVATIGWTLLFLIGAAVVIPSAFRATAEARPWSPRSLAVACAVAVVLTAITTSNLDVAVKGQLAAVRVEAGAKALAMVPPRLPNAQNAATIYRKAFAALTPREQLPTLLADRGQMWSRYDRTAFDAGDRDQREFLESQQRGLALLREAASVPQCSFERDWASEHSPVDMPVPELPHLRHGATLLAYDALARATRGDSKGALEDVAAIFGMARHIHYPLMIDLLAAVAIETTGAKALEDVLALAPPKPADLERLSAGASEPYREQLRRTFAMEEAGGMAAIVMIATGRAKASPDIREQTRMDAFGESLLDSAVYRVFFLEDDLATYRRHLRSFREVAALPTPVALEKLDAMEKSLRATRGGGILAGLLVPAVHQCLYAALDGDTWRGLVRLAVAATAYKVKHGKYPAKLGEMVPEFLAEIPADPYDGRPLRLRVVDGGIALYGLGRDRADDGGRPMDEKTREGDLVFRLR